MSTPQSPAGTMPARSSPSAPKFDGNQISLRRFLDEVRELGLENKMSDKKTIKSALSYLSSDDYPAWSALDSASGDDWNAFTTAVYAIYPGSDSADRQFTKGDLNQLVSRTRNAPMDTVDDFGLYYRSFNAISSFLKKRGRLGDAQQSEKFVEGLPDTLRDELRTYLRAKEPSHHADDPWTISQLYDAVIFVLGNTHRISSIHSHDPDHAKSSFVKPQVRALPAKLTDYLKSDQFMEKIAGMMIDARAHQPTLNPTQPVQRIQPIQNLGLTAAEYLHDIQDEIDHLEASTAAAQNRLDELRASAWSN